jgi:hypothetical protein
MNFIIFQKGNHEDQKLPDGEASIGQINAMEDTACLQRKTIKKQKSR